MYDGMFAYNRKTGRPVWQSGLVQSLSTSRDLWVLGTGPFENGTIRQGTVFAGEALALPRLPGGRTVSAPSPASLVPLTQAAAWPEPRGADAATSAGPVLYSGVASTLAALGRVLGGDGQDAAGKADDKSAAAKSTKATTPASAGSATNAGGVAETQPRKTVVSGLGVNSDD